MSLGGDLPPREGTQADSETRQTDSHHAVAEQSNRLLLFFSTRLRRDWRGEVTGGEERKEMVVAAASAIPDSRSVHPGSFLEDYLFS